MPLTKQIKSKERVAKHGEVFTDEKIVKAMCDLVKAETERIDSRFLEPACGNGNFLAEILQRKLAVVERRYGKKPAEYERYSLQALASIYGVELLADNVAECRDRLFALWDAAYTANAKKDAREECRDAARYIVRKNILCGNALSLKCVDENGGDTDEAIAFTEWSFINDLVQQRLYRFDVLLEENADAENYYCQQSLFGGGASDYENWGVDQKTGATIPLPIPGSEFSSKYWRVQDNG